MKTDDNCKGIFSLVVAVFQNTVYTAQYLSAYPVSNV